MKTGQQRLFWDNDEKCGGNVNHVLHSVPWDVAKLLHPLHPHPYMPPWKGGHLKNGSWHWRVLGVDEDTLLFLLMANLMTSKVSVSICYHLLLTTNGDGLLQGWHVLPGAGRQSAGTGNVDQHSIGLGRWRDLQGHQASWHLRVARVEMDGRVLVRLLGKISNEGFLCTSKMPAIDGKFPDAALNENSLSFEPHWVIHVMALPLHV